ncbi:hypothetical protein MQA16_17450, partial [Escherichia coli]|nr:hypothetical protein [Escherichia coli]
ADRNRSHWSTSKTPSYTKSVSWQHHQFYVYYDESSANERNLIEHLSAVRFNELNDTALQKQSKFIK